MLRKIPASLCVLCLPHCDPLFISLCVFIFIAGIDNITDQRGKINLSKKKLFDMCSGNIEFCLDYFFKKTNQRGTSDFLSRNLCG